MSTINVTNLRGKGGASPNLPDGANVTGVVTATSFVGSGEGLTGVASTDYIITGTAATFNNLVNVNSTLKVTGITTLGNLVVTKSAAGAGSTVGSYTGVTSYYGDGSGLTGVGETVAPWHYNPDVNAPKAPVTTGIGLTFNKKVSAGSGTATMKIVNAGTAGTTIQSWGISSVTFGVTDVTFGSLVSNLAVNQTYQVDIPAGYVVDSNETSYVGTAWTFTAQPAAGLLFTWGYDNDGMLGNKTANGHKSSPVQIPGTIWSTNSFFGSDDGAKFMISTKTDGTLWSWGSSDYGGLGVSHTGTGHVSSPIQISGTTWAQSSFGTFVGTAVKTDGTLWSWARNEVGQLGQNNTTQYSSPIQVGSDTTWKEVSAGDKSTGAIKTDGTLWVWGNNEFGMLSSGLAHDAHRSSPVQIPGTTWRNIIFGNRGNTLATKTDNTLWAWGRNNYGQLGLNNKTYYSSPVQIPGTTWSAAIGMGNYLSLATKTDGTLWSWGYNGVGQLGQNQPNNNARSSPTQIPGTTWSTLQGSVASSSYSPKAIKTDGTLWVWGHNQYGELGLNQPDNTKYSSPVQVPGTQWSRVRNLNNAAMTLQEDNTP